MQNILKYLFLLCCIPFFSGCFLDWEYNTTDYKQSLKTIFEEVNSTSNALSLEIQKSSLNAESEIKTPQVLVHIQKLQALKTQAENLPDFRGDDSYKKNIVLWIDSTLLFFEKDMLQFLKAPSQATTSDELQGTMQALYESTKKIKDAKKTIENQIEAL